MCVILTAKSGQLVSSSDIRDMVAANEDGTGVAWVEGGKVRVKRWLMADASEVAAFWADIEARGLPRMLHARLATHGGVCKELVHPFRLSDGSVLAHNGIITGVHPGKGESDTSAFVRMYVEPLIVELGADWLRPAVLKALGACIGSYNKLAILTPGGDIRLVNPGSGHWEPSGVWVSNRNWVGGSMYGGRGSWWMDHDLDCLPASRWSSGGMPLVDVPKDDGKRNGGITGWADPADDDEALVYGACGVCTDQGPVYWAPGYWGEAEYLCVKCARGLGVPGA